MTRAGRCSWSSVCLVLACACASVPARDSGGAAAAEGKSQPYATFADAIGIRAGIEAGILRDGQTMEFVASDPKNGVPLADAVVIIGHEPEPIVLRSDAQGRIAFPLRLDLVDANPEVRVISAVTEHPALSFTGTFSFKCDERGLAKTGGREWIRTEAFAKMRHQDFGRDRVYADGLATEPQMRAMGEHLVRLRAAYREVTGWDPPPLRVLLTAKAHEISTEADADGRGVWPMTPAEIDTRERSTAFLAHEWTHAAIAEHTSGGGDLGQRWLEDGLCELVAYYVEKRMFPAEPPTTLAARATELAAKDAKVPSTLALLEFGTADAKSLFGHLAAQCENGRLFGYAFSFAFWLAAARDEAALRSILAKLDAAILVTVARDAAPPAFADLALDLTCAQAVLAGDATCASSPNP